MMDISWVKVIPTDNNIILVTTIWFVSASIVYKVKMDREIMLKHMSVSIALIKRFLYILNIIEKQAAHDEICRW